MSVEDVFRKFVDNNGPDVLHDHVVQLWWTIQVLSEEQILELISELAEQYDDPIQAEIGLISLWNFIDKGGNIDA